MNSLLTTPKHGTITVIMPHTAD